MRRQDMVVDRLDKMPPLDTRRRSYLRLAEPSDGPLIHRLRSDPKLSRFLNAPPTTVQQQIAWLTRYKEDEATGQQYYFILVSDFKDRGTVRMYDFRTIDDKLSFCWGSWIIEPPPIVGLATYSALAIYELGFDNLGFEHAHFDVRRANSSVVAFHLRAGAEIVREDNQDYYFHFTREAYHRFRTAQAGTYDRHATITPNPNEGLAQTDR
ncbi:GNAT family N-acetyltransferase [Methylobacterium sp. J-088]|uniref:GNAT family N-acetyltransferase n=1 Tax=Methylobacterium sp. J-088 TaxID=2836664 RepID=UPI001FB86AF1|nr:GNAT family N-acetyltransferase [Methylobacterium sp. J-088]MCJ2064309.1 GNAT family N-acetyltransferase [Methylobacterium sp. J-088]